MPTYGGDSEVVQHPKSNMINHAFFWWQSQYSPDVDCRTDISINTVKATTHRGEKLQYCPEWSASYKPDHDPYRKDGVSILKQEAQTSG